MSKLNTAADLCLVVTEKTRLALEKKANEIRATMLRIGVEKEKSGEKLLTAVRPYAESFVKKVNARLADFIKGALVIKNDEYRIPAISFHEEHVRVRLAHKGEESYPVLKVQFPIVPTLPPAIRDMVRDATATTDTYTKMEETHSKIKGMIYDGRIGKAVRLTLAEARLAKESVDVDAMVTKMLVMILGKEGV